MGSVKRGSVLRWVFLLLIFILFLSLRAAESAPHRLFRAPLGKGGLAQPETDQVLQLLEEKIADRRILQKTKEKFESLDERQKRLIANLCDKIRSTGRNTGADISLLLMSILIILS
jgi:hypothetical protein